MRLKVSADGGPLNERQNLSITSGPIHIARGWGESEYEERYSSDYGGHGHYGMSAS